jgi:hypothetical protein
MEATMRGCLTLSAMAALATKVARRRGFAKLRGLASVVALCAGAMALPGARADGAEDAWHASPNVPPHIASLPAFVRPASGGAIFRIDWQALEQQLAQAPLEGHDVPPYLIDLPLPDGSLAPFRVEQAPVMEPALVAKFPDFRTYRVVGEAGSPAHGAVGRLDVTTQGLRAMIRTDGANPRTGTGGAYFIDPYSARDREFVGVYTTDQLGAETGDWTCHTLPDDAPHADADADQSHQPFASRGAVPIRTYRMAMACTGEYGLFHSQLAGNPPNVADAMAAIVTVVNRTNVTFELDLGVRFLLVANNDLVAFVDPATDPYPIANCDTPSSDCSGTLLSANPGALNTAIGSANYDVGHLLTRLPGGVANLRSVCTTNKARGISGIPRGGDLDPRSALVPMHELGHQFGANHTFNGTRGRCAGNIASGTAWEPGGGSTLMSYPGACPVGGPIGEGDTDNLVLFADPYFNVGSLLEMRAFLASATASCSQSVVTSNTEPAITSVATEFAVPRLTPFTLSLQYSDDSPAPLVTWEQQDLGPRQPLTGAGSEDNATSPLFRSFPPASPASRTFPRWSDLLASTTYVGEELPSLTASRKFRATVRDGQGASTISPVVTVQVQPAGPFQVTNPNAGTTLRPGTTLSVSWDVAGTNAPPFNVPSVRIALSVGAGDGFPITLAAAAPNTGSASFALSPLLTSGDASILIEPAGSSFFAVSQAFRILPCDSIDFNRDEVYPDSTDLADLFLVFSGGACPTDLPQGQGCNDIDFNNDGVFPDLADVIQYLEVFAGGAC